MDADAIDRNRPRTLREQWMTGWKLRLLTRLRGPTDDE